MYKMKNESFTPDKLFLIKALISLRNIINIKYVTMKVLFLFILLFVIITNLRSQSSLTTLKFSETHHNFGTFQEEAGPQTVDFIVTNTGPNPLIIKKVVASCGCATSGWTKEPILAGKTGKVTVVYDPAKRPGTFNKTITVYANSKPEVIILEIKGEVLPRKKKK